MKLTKILSATAFFTINKELVKKIGIESTLVLADLISKEEYFQERNMVDDGYFFNTLDNIKDDTTLSHFKIRNALNKLVKHGFIEAKLKGIPAKTYIKIMHSKILNNLTSCSQISSHLINKNKSNNFNTKVLKAKTTRFLKPKIEELKEYFKERGNIDEVEVFFDYYESKGWKVGNAPMKCWKATVRNWLRRAETKTKETNKEFPNYYDRKVEYAIGNDSSKLTRYHKHLRDLGWTCVHSPTSGTIWKK